MPPGVDGSRSLEFVDSNTLTIPRELETHKVFPAKGKFLSLELAAHEILTKIGFKGSDSSIRIYILIYFFIFFVLTIVLLFSKGRELEISLDEANLPRLSL